MHNGLDNLINIPPLVDVSMEKWDLLDNVIDENRIDLVYAGSPAGVGKDRLDRIIYILSKITITTDLNIRFTVLGVSKKDYKKLFGEESVPANLDEFTEFKGKVNHVDAIKYVSKARYQIFIRDSNLINTAGFPTKFVESISCGTPVLANSSSNIERYLLPGKSGFLLNMDSDLNLLQSVLGAISVSPLLIKEMKSFCKSSHMFDYKRYLEVTAEFMDRAIKSLD